MPPRIDALEPAAPDIVLAWRGIDDGVHDLMHLEQLERIEARLMGMAS